MVGSTLAATARASQRPCDYDQNTETIIEEKSRCEVPRETPLDWLYFRKSEDDTPEVLREMAQVFSGLTDVAKVALYAEFNDTMRLAAMGELNRGDFVDVAKVFVAPELWELRWDTDGVLYRLYHAEPPRNNDVLAALRFHTKGPEMFDDSDAQRAEMLIAAARYTGMVQEGSLV